jgi:hypothetical protein
MTALRTTRPDTADRRPARATGRRKDVPLLLALGLGAALVGVSGCGSDVADGANPDPAPYRPCMVLLPPPTVDQVRFDATTRRLSFTDPTGPSARWMVKRSDVESPLPVGPEVTLPEGLNADDTFVYYTRPGGQTSRHLTLAQILAAKPEHVSEIR